MDDGTTACVALVIGQRLFVANGEWSRAELRGHRAFLESALMSVLSPHPPDAAAGDSRAVLVQRRGRVEALSIDHKVGLACCCHWDSSVFASRVFAWLVAVAFVFVSHPPPLCQPHRVDEKMRIKRQGGNVYLVGVWRVQGILAVSR